VRERSLRLIRTAISFCSLGKSNDSVAVKRSGCPAGNFLKSTMDPLLIFVAVIGVGAGAGAYALTMRDLVRRGRLHRQKERLRLEGQPLALPDGRVPCPECAEAIL